MKNKNFIIFSSITVIFCFTLFIIKYINDTRNDYQIISEKMLFQEASNLFNNIITLQKYSDNHNNIYTDFTDKHHINPYFKMTSLHPINPKNSPDIFEKAALEELKRDKNKEFYTSLAQDRYNFVASLKAQDSCLKCHNTSQYKTGDVIGGLRVSIPIESYKENIEIIDAKTNILYFVSFFTSIIFMIIITFTVHSIYEKEFNIMRLNKTLENKVHLRTKELRVANKKLLEISTTDYLTNLSNRRHFFEIGTKAFHLSKREKNDLSIICIDIDFFKKINDTYGHNIGDEVLKFIANKMSKFIRKSDILARMGGEEFCILLNNTNEQNAYLLAEKLRENIEKGIYKNEEVQIQITISLGISQLKQEDDELDYIISRADKALYIAKQSNRNKTIIHS